MPRKTTSIKVDPQLWKEVKKHCVDTEQDISDYVEALLRSDLDYKSK